MRWYCTRGKGARQAMKRKDKTSVVKASASWHLQVAAMIFGGTHAAVRDLLSCRKRLLA